MFLFPLILKEHVQLPYICLLKEPVYGLRYIIIYSMNMFGDKKKSLLHMVYQKT